MKHSKGFIKSDKAFTLIELLVVIGLIAALASGVGLALRGNNPDSSLRSGQSLTLGALSSARGQAALTQANARIVVQANSASPNFLRSIRVVVADAATAGGWKQVGSEIILPEGIYVVPPLASNVTDVSFDSSAGGWTAAKQTALQSSLFNTATENLTPALSDGLKLLTSKPMTSLGAIDGGNIFVTSGRLTGPTTLVLDNASSVRGLVVSRYGVASLVNDTDSF